MTKKKNLIWHSVRRLTLIVIGAVPAISGKGLFNAQDRIILYSVVYSDEVTPLINAIHAVDGDAFINVIKTEQINGRFFKKPKD